MRLVEDDRLVGRELVLEKPGQAPVPALGHAPDLLDDLGLVGVIVDVKMLGLEDAPPERLVTDLVLAEILGSRRTGPQQGRRQTKDSATRRHLRLSPARSLNWRRRGAARFARA
jgi:hypothetical protein